MLASHGFLAATWLQTTDFNSGENTHLLIIFIGILAVSVAIIAIAVLVAALVVAKAVKRVMQITEEVKGKSMPLIASTQGIIGSVQGVVADLRPKIKTVTDDLIPKVKSVTDDLAPKIKAISDDLQPKIKAISGNVEEMSTLARNNLVRFDQTLNAASETVKDVNSKAKAQVDRVDEMVSSALTATSHVAQAIHHSVRVPVNQFAGMVNGLKTGVESLVESTSRRFGRSARAKAPEVSLEEKREEEMERITSRYESGSSHSTGAVSTRVGDDILSGSSVPSSDATGTEVGSGPGFSSDSRTMAADVVAGQRRAAEMRSAPDASDLSEPSKPVLPKRFQ